MWGLNNMNDKTAIALFVGLGLVGAYFGLAPMRKPASDIPKMGASLATGELYAEGTISLAPGLEGKVNPGAALFLFAKASGMQGAPLAVKRIESLSFPLNFSLTTADSMMAMDFYDGDLTVTARISQSGTAGPKQPGDLEKGIQIKKGESRKVQLEIAG